MRTRRTRLSPFTQQCSCTRLVLETVRATPARVVGHGSIRDATLPKGAHYTCETGLSLRNGNFLYRRTPLKRSSRVAGSHTRPLRGENCRPVFRRVVKHPAEAHTHYVDQSRITEIRNEMTAAMGNAHLSPFTQQCSCTRPVLETVRATPAGSAGHGSIRDATLGCGAKHTHKQRFTAPDIGGFPMFTAFSREYAGNTRPVRGIPAGRLFAVCLAPGAFLPGSHHAQFTALNKRSKQRSRSMRVFRTVPSPVAHHLLSARVAGHGSIRDATLGYGAQHTKASGLSLPRESDFFVSVYFGRPGSALAIQDPPRRGRRRACLASGVEVPGSITSSTGVTGLPQQNKQVESSPAVSGVFPVCLPDGSGLGVA